MQSLNVCTKIYQIAQTGQRISGAICMQGILVKRYVYAKMLVNYVYGLCCVAALIGMVTDCG